MTPIHARRILRLLYLINGIASAAAAIVLVVAPRTIPAAVFADASGPSEPVTVAVESVLPGALHLPPELIMVNLSTFYFLSYLLAAAELALATLCGFAFRSPDRATHVLAVPVLVIWHLASIMAGLAVIMTAQSVLLLWNVVIRVVIIAALLACAKAALRR